MITVVTKAFESRHGILKPGQIVDSTEMRNEQKLIDQRYLRAATEAERATFATPGTPVEAATVATRGRKPRARKPRTH